jgi:hypothetical protein
MSLPDAAQGWNFDLIFTSIPGSNLSSENLTYKVKSTTIPTSSIEPVKIELHGVAKQEAGRATYEHTFNCVIMETVDWATYQAMRQWRDYMRSWKNNTGANSSAYKVRLELDLYDNAGAVVRTIVLVGAFPTAIGEVALDGAQSTVIDLNMTFSFDYVDDGQSF